MRKQIGIRTKLAGCMGLVAAGSVAASVYSVMMIRTLEADMQREIAGSAAKLDHARQLTIGLANMRITMRGYSLFAITREVAMRDKQKDGFDAGVREMRAVIEQMRGIELSGEESASVDTISQSLDQWANGMPKFFELTIRNATEGSKFALANLTPKIDAIQKNAKTFGEQSAAREEAAMKRMEASIAQFQWIETAAVLIVLLISGAGLWIVMGMVRALREIAASVDTGARQVASAAAQVSSSSQNLAQGTTEGAASIEETSASTEQIKAMAAQNSENSKNAAEIVAQSASKFQQTDVALQDMVVAMGQISASSEKISKIIKVIDEIAFQTNILALNAAVEAARAGEAGMGFAVVADEVRNLAQRCSQAARDTSQLIEESIATSGSGKAKVDRVAEAIRAVTGEASRVKTLVDEISAGSLEQSKGIEQISKGMAQLESAGQTSAASAEESAAAAEELTAQAATLMATGRQLRGLMEGSAVSIE